MKTLFVNILLLLVPACAAFSPSLVTGSQQASSRNIPLRETKADLEKIAEEANPQIKFFDPLKLADQEFWNLSNEGTIAWIRHSEIKHGRIAMAAFVGYVVQSNFVFPWAQTLSGAAHPSADLTPEAQWDAIPKEAKWQIILFIGFLEVWDEIGGGGFLPHYTKGRKPGQYPPFDNFRKNIHPVLNLYDPFNLSEKRDEESKERGLVSELNNGRLAMISIFAFVCENKIPGSVPILSTIGASQGYAGNPMAPFEVDFASLI